MRPAGFWGRWVLANAAGELAGLGTVALAAWMLVSSLEGPQTLLAHILFAIALILAGALEGAVVGAAQTWVLVRRLPALPAWDWVRATALGSLAAWALGMLPSTLMAAATEGSAALPAEPGGVTFYGLAALLGLATGLVLSIFQARVLRRHLSGAWGWLAANAAAWALGMPLVFLGADLASREGTLAAVAGRVAVTLAVAGAVAGAIHGLWLVWKLRTNGAGEVPSREPAWHRTAALFVLGLLALAPLMAQEPTPLLPNERHPAPGLLTGGAPTSAAGFEALAKAGYRTFIDLRSDAELSPETRAAAEAAGLRYERIPVAGDQDLNLGTARALDTLLDQREAQPVVVACASGNRVGALLAVRAFWLDGTTAEEALAFGRQAGLTRLEPSVRSLLGLPAVPAAEPKDP